MARSYGNTKISTPRDTFNRVRRKDRKKPRPRPIINEETPMPDKYEGDIVFNKTIYSKTEFENKIDTEFTELTTDQPSVSIEEFFNFYNEIFFDIPKEGENSHATIIQTSTDYFEDYRSPLQDIIDSKDLEIEELNRRALSAEARLNDLIAEIAEDEAEEAIAAAQEDADNAAYEAEYGIDFATNPLLKYGNLKSNLATMESRGLLRKSEKKNLNDLRQAKEKENNNTSKRSYNEWNAAIDKRAEGKVKDDLRDLISLTRASIAAGNGYQI
jgi:hypothetical protein